MKNLTNKIKASPIAIQKRWIPKCFHINKEFGCLTNAERLSRKNPKLTFVVGRTRVSTKDKWGDHAWCVTPKGYIIDPYFQFHFPTKWKKIEYVIDNSVFDGSFA